MENYDQLKSIIQQANPEIMEWRCEGCDRKYAEYINGCVFCWRDELTREENLKLFPKRSVRQVPREIRLADVLLAIFISEDKNKIAVDAFGEFRNVETEFRKFTGIYWKLEDDNLNHQSDETKQFLIDLLVE